MPSWTIATECAIDAPAPRVWSILREVGDYPQWNPLIRELHGSLQPGSHIRFRVDLRGLRAWAKATVLTMREERELRWTGHVLFDWLFRAEHYHLVEPRAGTGVSFRHGEIFSGALMPLAWLLLRRGGPSVYEAVNTALKRRAEHGAATRAEVGS
jgi:hypothetical protein